jgi:hypothetical protein
MGVQFEHPKNYRGRRRHVSPSSSSVVRPGTVGGRYICRDAGVPVSSYQVTIREDASITTCRDGINVAPG